MRSAHLSPRWCCAELDPLWVSQAGRPTFFQLAAGSGAGRTPLPSQNCGAGLSLIVADRCVEMNCMGERESPQGGRVPQRAGIENLNNNLALPGWAYWTPLPTPRLTGRTRIEESRCTCTGSTYTNTPNQQRTRSLRTQRLPLQQQPGLPQPTNHPSPKSVLH